MRISVSQSAALDAAHSDVLLVAMRAACPDRNNWPTSVHVAFTSSDQSCHLGFLTSLLQ